MNRLLRAATLVSVAAATLTLALYAVPSGAQDLPDPNWKPAGPVPRTPDGKPDLSGVWWPGALPTVEDATVVVPRRGGPPPAPGSSFASLYQPWAAEKAKMLAEKDDPSLRCMPAVHGSMRYTVFQLVQTPLWLVLLNETYHHGFRLIPLHPGRTHNEAAAPSYWGDSVGRWEDDTLVVDVTSFNDRGWINNQGVVSFHSDALHVVERYRRIAANALEVEKIYDDPKVLTRPWIHKATYRLAPFDQVVEFNCTGTETAALIGAAASVP